MNDFLFNNLEYTSQLGIQCTGPVLVCAHQNVYISDGTSLPPIRGAGITLVATYIVCMIILLD